VVESPKATIVSGRAAFAGRVEAEGVVLQPQSAKHIDDTMTINWNKRQNWTRRVTL
jgi:hypothetical protein